MEQHLSARRLHGDDGLVFVFILCEHLLTGLRIAVIDFQSVGRPRQTRRARQRKAIAGGSGEQQVAVAAIAADAVFAAVVVNLKGCDVRGNVDRQRCVCRVVLRHVDVESTLGRQVVGEGRGNGQGA